MTPLERATRLSNLGLAVTTVGFVALAGVYVRALAFTPLERFQGPAQKIFYVHVPAAFCALLAFGIVGVISLLYLWLKDERLDLFSASAAEVGVAFSVVMLTTGPLWGKPVWGTWWTWDARLTLTLFLFFLFVGYLLLRNAVPEPTQRARYSAVLGISGLVLIPFIHISVYLFRTLHPEPILLKPGRPSLPTTMLTTLLLSLGVFAVLLVGFLMQRYGLALTRAAREERGLA
jgi:heme exporter protein C